MAKGDSGGESDNSEPSTGKEGGDDAANGVENAPVYEGDGVSSDHSTSMSGDLGGSFDTGEETKNGENDKNENRDNQESYPEDVIFKQPQSIDDANKRETDNKIDKADEIESKKEQEAYNKLETIKTSSKNWVCQIQERTPFSTKIGPLHGIGPNTFKHTFLTFINIKAGEAEIVTISYNGMKGEWWINTESDIESQKNNKNWSVADVTPKNGINIEATINNIQKMILSGEDSYAVSDGLIDWNNEYNCNTAAESVMVENKDKK